MKKQTGFVHPYIPNSVPDIKADMLREIGVSDVEELYGAIPEELRLKGKLDLPEPFPCEHELKRHVMGLLSGNRTCEENLNFLGGGCWQHYVPAICDEINGRSEFLTAYGGTPYSNLGRMQAIFEFQSQMGELLDMDVVSVPTYSWGAAAGNAIRMASRLTNRYEVLVAGTTGPERLATVKTFCGEKRLGTHIEVNLVRYDKKTGLLDLQDLKDKISAGTASVYIENPSYLGTIETQGRDISKIAHANGAISIVGVDPISLGILAPPSDYQADIVVGTAQPLGIHMFCGGGTIGFIASRDEEAYVSEYPSFLLSITDTIEVGEHGFGLCSKERTSYMSRAKAKDWVGTATGLWTITAAVYMALLGPQGFKDIGETIIQKSHYAEEQLSGLKGVKHIFSSPFFKEFLLNFDETGKTVRDINRALLDYNIYGGKDISSEFPELGNSALFCVTEIHTKEDIHRILNALEEILNQ